MRINKKIHRYIRKNDVFSLSDIMATFLLDYASATSILDSFKKKKMIKQLDDLRYKYISPPQKKSDKAEDENNIAFDIEELMKTIDITDDSSKVTESDSDFENVCIELIEKIVLSSSSITKAEALQKTTEYLELFEKSTDTVMVGTLQRAKKEFEQYSDEDFLALRKKLHENKE